MSSERDNIYESEKTYGDGFGAGYAQAIADADAQLRQLGDDRTIRECRQLILALVNVPYAKEEVCPRPDWTKYRVPAVRDYPTPQTKARAALAQHRLGKNPDRIWLAPACNIDERTWCEHDPGCCDECGEPSVEYRLVEKPQS